MPRNASADSRQHRPGWFINRLLAAEGSLNCDRAQAERCYVSDDRRFGPRIGGKNVRQIRRCQRCQHRGADLVGGVCIDAGSGQQGAGANVPVLGRNTRQMLQQPVDQPAALQPPGVTSVPSQATCSGSRPSSSLAPRTSALTGICDSTR